MEIFYKSTRGASEPVAASQAVLNGLAPDGGLYVPERIPVLTEDLSELCGCSYRKLAYIIMSKFLTDYTKEELEYCISSAYDSKFDTEEIAPLYKTKNAWFLELYHGKTIAFKDMALSILPYLMTTAAKKNNLKEELVILTATSGDTGKAALAGFADVPGTRIIVFYPKDGVSPVQELQMTTQKGKNTKVIAIRGNFDDAQSGVKRMFASETLKHDILKKGFKFSSANSINIGRLVPQVVYYVYAYLKLVNAGEITAGEKINFTVPTGNFGNILAAYYAKLMGLPVNKLICASNKNKVLFDFFNTGDYDKNREFYLTSSPSMDILVSSNLERLLYMASGCSSEVTRGWMESLAKNGRYSVPEAMRPAFADFASGFAGEDECASAIKNLYESEGYVIDPHTAVAAAVYNKYKTGSGDGSPCVIASTASPYKFARSVLCAIDEKKYGAHSDMQQFDDLEAVSNRKQPEAILELKNADVRHTMVVDAGAMEAAVRESLGV